MRLLSKQQTHQTQGGTTMELTNDFPEFRPMPFEKFYTIIVKSLCDYHAGAVDLSVM